MKALINISLVLTLFIACSSATPEVATPKKIDTPYTPEKIEYLPDVKVMPTSVACQNYQPGAEPQNMLDGDLSKGYHSRWGQNQPADYWPINIDFFFDDVDQLHSLTYYPRSTGGNGPFKEVEIWYSTKKHPELQKLMEYNFHGSLNPANVVFPVALDEPTQIRLVVKSGVNSFAQCSEMEFYKKNSKNYDPYTIFKDKACTTLKEDITLKDINKIPNTFFKNLATHLFNKSYDFDCRVENYSPYPHPEISAKKYKISTYSLRDNPTGIYVNEGENLVVMVGDTHNQTISLLVQDLDKGFGGPTYSLSEGVNIIKMQSKGLIYVMYYTDEATEEPIKIHFANGSKNGVYRLGKHSELDYKVMLSNAACPYIDLIGEYAHLTFPVSNLLEAGSSAEDLLGVYENIVSWEQEFLGLFKYHTRIPNHMYFMYDIKGKCPYATAYRTAYHKGALKLICNASKLKIGEGCWGPAHEVGHVNQTRPGFKWIGMTEVSNNVMSLYVQTRLAKVSRLQVNGVYDRAFANLKNKNIPHVKCKDVFVKLVPFWQLHLYCAHVKGYPDFYKDLYETIRKNPDIHDNGACQLNFIRITCRLVQEDLTAFFKAWGMLEPVDTDVTDYKKEKLVITTEMIDELKADIAKMNLPQPQVKVEDITDATVKQLKNNLLYIPLSSSYNI